MELEARGRCRKRSVEGSSHDYSLVSSHLNRLPHQSHSWLSRDRSNESKDAALVSLRKERGGHPNAARNAMSRTLRRIARSPFFEEIELIEMPRHFICPPFTCYYGKTDLLDHISHFTQLMAFYSWKDRLLCKVFLSSLGPKVMRWFNNMKKGSIHSFIELI